MSPLCGLKGHWFGGCVRDEGHAPPFQNHIRYIAYPDERVLPRVHRDAAGPKFGRTPHDDRVLAIVLVMPGGETRRFVPDGLVEPNTPHAEEFWQDLGRPLSGHERTSEAVDAGAGVQRACPNVDRNLQCTEALERGCICEWVNRGQILTFHPYCPILRHHRGAPKSPIDFTVEQLDRAAAMVTRRENAHKHANAEARLDLLERLGAVSEPYRPDH